MTQLYIPQARLERYSDFVSRHSDNGVYNPEKGLEGLLASITPDSKVPVLNGMQTGDVYFTKHQLRTATLNWLDSIGVDRSLFKMDPSAVWEYCQRRDKEGNEVDGSLVNVGVVVKEVYDITPEGLRTGYHVSTAGQELAIPTGLDAIEFVHQARNNKNSPKYKSMGRLLGGVQSRTGKRRPLAVYKIVKFLAENQGHHRFQDIVDALKDDINQTAISYVLNSLGAAEIIDYESPARDIEGKRTKGWVTYSRIRTEGLDSVYERIRQKNPKFYSKANLSEILKFIEANPNLKYESNDIATKLQIYVKGVQHILSSLAEANIGILRRESSFRGTETLTRARANDFTHMFYEIVLQPAWYSASTLTPTELRPINSNKIIEFLENNQEETSHIGPGTGEEIRNVILHILSSGEEVKKSSITNAVNEALVRGITEHACGKQLDNLIHEELVEKARRGFYKITS